jgi:hypothetical protein
LCNIQKAFGKRLASLFRQLSPVFCGFVLTSREFAAKNGLCAGEWKKYVACRTLVIMVTFAKTNFISIIVKALKIAWTSPNSCLGLLGGVVLLALGGKAKLVGGALEFSAGRGIGIFSKLPNGPIAAITIGHVILGMTDELLQRVRAHEHVHVRQYERWGPLFIPAYLGWSLFLLIQGRDPYRENPFEIEAYREVP